MHLTEYIVIYISLNILNPTTPYIIGSMTQLASPAEDDHLSDAVDAPCILNSNCETSNMCNQSPSEQLTCS